MMALLILFSTSVLHQSCIGGWCQDRVKIFTQSVLYLYYLLSREKKNFVNIVLNNCGRGRGKHLCIQFDEKWFWGIILWKTYNYFDGIKTETVREYHKSHTSKTMGIDAAVMYFGDSLDNGGIEIKLVFQIYQIVKVRQKNLVGKNVVIIKNKRDTHYVDCNVTLSNDVT